MTGRAALHCKSRAAAKSLSGSARSLSCVTTSPEGFSKSRSVNLSMPVYRSSGGDGKGRGGRIVAVRFLGDRVGVAGKDGVSHIGDREQRSDVCGEVG